MDCLVSRTPLAGTVLVCFVKPATHVCVQGKWSAGTLSTQSLSPAQESPSCPSQVSTGRSLHVTLRVKEEKRRWILYRAFSRGK